MNDLNKIIDKLYSTRNASDAELKLLIDADEADYLREKALDRRR